MDAAIIHGHGIPYIGSRMSMAMDSITGKVTPTLEHMLGRYLRFLMPMWQELRIEKYRSYAVACGHINQSMPWQISTSTPGWLYPQCASLSPNSWNSTGKPLDWCPTVCVRPHLMVSRSFITATACRSGGSEPGVLYSTMGHCP